ncbi:MAG: hypothetical protein ACOY3P_16040 [Planctomycetota bacterium]
MSDKMRWRYGDTNPVVAAVEADTVISIGDLVFQETDHALPAVEIGDHGGAAGNQSAFAESFLGVAMQRSRAEDTAPVRVATTGVFEFDCAEAAFELGDLVGVRADATTGTLSNQALEKVTDAAAAIGRVARREAAATTRVLVDVRSTVMTGGVRGSMAASGT